MTNADRFRQGDERKLAISLSSLIDCVDCPAKEKYCDLDFECCVAAIEKWLKQESWLKQEAKHHDER